jgi:nucleoside-diphosphate-sugar epimerase
VTGGSGFIGRHLVTALMARGDRVRILDLEPPREALPGVEYVRGSILDDSVVASSLRDIEHVYHLAGISHLWAQCAGDFRRVNCDGTKALLVAAREAGVARFLYCSSETVDLAASAADLPGPYSRSKFLAEQAVRAAARDGLPVVIVAPTVTLGPDDDNSTPGTAMLAGFLARRLQFYFNCILNLVDVRDVARGMVLAGKVGRAGERYLLGGTNISVSELLALIERITKRKRVRIPVPGTLAFIIAAFSEIIATYITHRLPLAPVEGVRLARILPQIVIEKAQRELGYETRPLQSTLEDAVADWDARGL